MRRSKRPLTILLSAALAAQLCSSALAENPPSNRSTSTPSHLNLFGRVRPVRKSESRSTGNRAKNDRPASQAESPAVFVARSDAKEGQANDSVSSSFSIPLDQPVVPTISDTDRTTISEVDEVQPSGSVLPASHGTSPNRKTVVSGDDSEAISWLSAATHEDCPNPDIELSEFIVDETDVDSTFCVDPNNRVEPLFEQAVDEDHWFRRHFCCDLRYGLHKYAKRHKGDAGIGRERLPFAPFMVESSTPTNSFRFRIDGAEGLDAPDRAEFFWRRIGQGGPEQAEQEVDYQRAVMTFETGSESFSTAVDVPLVSLDPIVNSNTTGLGDLAIRVKQMLIDGPNWQLTPVLTTFVPTGKRKRGLGTGNVSLEPGLLGMWRFSDTTHVHAALQYRIPIGGHPTHSGSVIHFGSAVSHILYETDTWSVLPTLELSGWSAVDGQKTLTDGSVVQVDGDLQLGLHPGVRVVLGPENELGLFELGISGGFASNSRVMFERLMRIELRWSF